MSELFFDVPKDYSKPADGNLRLFARSVERVEKPTEGAKEEKKHVPWCRLRAAPPYVRLLLMMPTQSSTYKVR